MGHKFDPKNVARLDDPARLGYQPVRDVLGLLELNGDETVVDYGAGTGIYTVAVAAALPRGRVIAVEALLRLAELLRARITPELGERLAIIETDSNTVPQTELPYHLAVVAANP